MENFTPLLSIIGGSLIGLAAVALFRLNGRIAGISGMLHGLMDRSPEQRRSRLLFIGGLILGGFLFSVFGGIGLSGVSNPPLWLIAAAGLLVGIGTRLGSGCTSGHGICGVARLSNRSVVATITFLLLGFLSASLLRPELVS